MVQRFWQIIIVLMLVSACTGTVEKENADNMMDGTSEGMMDKSGPEMMDEPLEDMMGESMEEKMEEMIQPDKTFVLTGENFKFLMDGSEAPELQVKVGDRVRIEFTSTSGFHDWVVDEFGAATKQVKPENGMTSVEFVADKEGTFEYYCSVGSHRANGMKGNLVVS